MGLQRLPNERSHRVLRLGVVLPERGRLPVEAQSFPPPPQLEIDLLQRQHDVEIGGILLVAQRKCSFDRFVFPEIEQRLHKKTIAARIVRRQFAQALERVQRAPRRLTIHIRIRAGDDQFTARVATIQPEQRHVGHEHRGLLESRGGLGEFAFLVRGVPFLDLLAPAQFRAATQGSEDRQDQQHVHKPRRHDG